MKAAVAQRLLDRKRGCAWRRHAVLLPLACQKKTGCRREGVLMARVAFCQDTMARVLRTTHELVRTLYRRHLAGIDKRESPVIAGKMPAVRRLGGVLLQALSS